MLLKAFGLRIRILARKFTAQKSEIFPSACTSGEDVVHQDETSRIYKRDLRGNWQACGHSWGTHHQFKP